MAFSSIIIKYKPLRVGFLVQEGSIQDLIRAAGINSVLWGGIYNPILPISKKSNEFAKQLMELYSVDLLYSVSETPEIQSFRKEYPFLRDPGLLADKIFYEDWDSKKFISGILDIKNIVDLYWTKEFKTKPEGYKSQFLMLKWEKEDPLATVFALQFGFFPEMNLKWNYEQIFIKGLCSQEKKISPDDNITFDVHRSFGPINLTGYELRGYRTGVKLNGNGFFLGESNNFNDLLSFWNIRAAGNDVVFVAIDYLERIKPFSQNFLDHLNGLPNKHPEIEDWLYFYANIEDIEAIKKLSTEFVSKKHITWHRLNEYSWNGLNIQPNYYAFNWQQATMHIEKSYNRYVTNIQLPEMKFLVDNDYNGHQQLGVIIEPYSTGEHDHPGYTLKVPYIRSLTEFYSRELTFDLWSLRIEKNGFSKIIKPRTESISIYPLPIQSLVKELFKIVGIEAKMSQPGLIAKKIIEKIDGIENARVLKIKGVRILLENGSPETAITRGQATLTIKNNNFDKHKQLYIEPRSTSELDSNTVFDYLLKNNYFRAGLELTCEYCRLLNWLSLKNIDDYWNCEFCGGQNQTSPQLKHRGDWKFRKSGLFSKHNHQERSHTCSFDYFDHKKNC